MGNAAYYITFCHRLALTHSAASQKWVRAMEKPGGGHKFRRIYCIVAGARVVKVNLNINSRSWERLVG